MKSGSFVLVTGGAGYIGSQTCKELHLSGFKPVVLDNLSTGFRHNVKWGPLLQGELSDKSFLNDAFKKYQFEGIIHFAASAYVGDSVAQPIKYFDNNIGITCNLLEVATKHNVRKIVFSSSCATYGQPESEFISEDVLQNPINPYGFTKLACEKLLKYLSDIGEINFASLRYFNAAGADPDLEIGELHSPESHILPLLIQAALSKNTFTIFGNDYKTNDGTCIRDYIHVKDLAKAHVLALQHLLSNGDSIEVNLGSGLGISNLQLVEYIQDLGFYLDFEFGARRLGDPDRLVASNSLAKEILGWEPINSDIKTVISSAISWHEKLKTNR